MVNGQWLMSLVNGQWTMVDGLTNYGLWTIDFETFRLSVFRSFGLPDSAISSSAQSVLTAWLRRGYKAPANWDIDLA